MGLVELWGKYWAAAQDQGFIFVCLLMVVLFAVAAVASFLVYCIWCWVYEIVTRVKTFIEEDQDRGNHWW